MKRTLLSVPMLALLTTSAMGQAWPLEPTTVLGARLGVPVQDIGIPRCASEDYHSSPEPCISALPSPIPGYPPTYRIGGHPFSYAAFTVEVDEAGTVTGIRVWMKQLRYGDFTQTLVERYGKPTLVTDSTVQSKAGAIYPSRTMTWTGSKLSIYAFERPAKVDESIVLFKDVAAEAREQSARDSKVRGSASKL